MDAKKVKTLTAISVGAVLLGLIGHITRQIYLVKQIAYSLQGFVINDLKNNNLTASVVLRVHNKSDVTATIENYDIDAYINGINVGKIDYSKKQTIKANGDTDIIIRFNVPLKQYFNITDVLNLVKYYLTDKSKINFALKGALKIKHSVFTINLPINNTFNLTDFGK